MRVAALAALAALAAAATACGRSAAVMIAVPPPTSWSHDLASARAEKDAFFRESPESPLPSAARAAFRALEYYAADPSWRYAGYVERHPQPEKMTMITTAGKARPCERWGTARFERDGKVVALQIYRLLDQPERSGGEGLFLPFKDATTGKETYAAGRYVDLVGPDDGPFTLDFNDAYNPSCAYGEPERFQCPVTPAENTLPLAVHAGERGPSAAHGSVRP